MRSSDHGFIPSSRSKEPSAIRRISSASRKGDGMSDGPFHSQRQKQVQDHPSSAKKQRRGLEAACTTSREPQVKTSSDTSPSDVKGDFVRVRIPQLRLICAPFREPVSAPRYRAPRPAIHRPPPYLSAQPPKTDRNPAAPARPARACGQNDVRRKSAHCGRPLRRRNIRRRNLGKRMQYGPEKREKIPQTSVSSPCCPAGKSMRAERCPQKIGPLRSAPPATEHSPTKPRKTYAVRPGEE